ncbi:hypothetical protein CXB40_11140 [Pseudomonas syringae pv. avii]|nr:hypothetical protein CXB40_11140 [Pseudomonas syringae pv. avii]
MCCIGEACAEPIHACFHAALTPLWTLCVESEARDAAQSCDAERHERHDDAERRTIADRSLRQRGNAALDAPRPLRFRTAPAPAVFRARRRWRAARGRRG